MASEAKDETNPEHINLKVMGQDGNIVQFKIKKHTALKSAAHEFETSATMGAGASTIADYKEAASKSDEASFPDDDPKPSKDKTGTDNGSADKGDTAQVVSLDSFRKK